MDLTVPYGPEAAQLREQALALDADPVALQGLLGSDAFTRNRLDCTPERFRPAGSPGVRSCRERVRMITALSRGDASAVLGCPGPALAGLVVDQLGTPQQQAFFYDRIADGRTWTFFAMTEPEAGSDAANLVTRLDPDPDRAGGYRLTGHKRYVGNGDRGAIGVVFARTDDSVLGVRAVLLELPAPGALTRPLTTLGLRGAGLADMRFENVPVPPPAVLGAHLSATRRGLWAALRTFHQVRTQIGGMAVGTSQALHDYVTTHFPDAAGLSVMGLRIEAAHRAVLAAASQLDVAPGRVHVSSSAKLTGTRLVTQVADWAMAAVGPGAWADHPLLEKWARDARGFEFMDGTGHMQRLALARGYLREIS